MLRITARHADQWNTWGAPELGFDQFIVPDWNLGTSNSERADRLARVKTEVLNHLVA